MAGYGRSSLQQEAQSRIKQMYRYADIPPQETVVQAADEINSLPQSAETNDIPPSLPDNQPHEPKKNSVISENPLQNILKIFSGGGGIENDHIILLLLIFVLLREGAALKLIAALAYIML